MTPDGAGGAARAGSGDPRHRLVLVRHAQATPFAETDHARPLTERGRGDARALGRWLAATLGDDAGPGAALVSDAVRARQTWELLAAAAGWEATVEPQRAVYEAGPAALLDLVRGVDEGARSVVVVGHNPTLGVLVQLLDDGTGDPDAVTATLAGHPTAGAAVVEVPGPWGELAEAAAVLRAFHVGRG